MRMPATPPPSGVVLKQVAPPLLMCKALHSPNCGGAQKIVAAILEQAVG